MLNNEELDRVDTYIMKELTIKCPERYEDLQNEIILFSMNPKYAKERIEYIVENTIKLREKMYAEFKVYCCITPRLLFYNEIYSQLRITLCKLIGKDDTHDLAALTLASSFDYFWFTEQNKKYNGQDTQEREPPEVILKNEETSIFDEEDYDELNDELPF